MTLPNDGILVTPGSGATVATHLVGTKEYQTMMQADSSGHIMGSLETYFYSTPAAAVGADKLYLDLFNGVGSGKVIGIRGIWAIPKTDVAVTGALAIRVDLYRTSAVGTGGTAAAYKSATRDVAGGCITPSDTANSTLPSQITARHLPSGGATISEWIFPAFLIGEETATSMAYLTQYQNLMPCLMSVQKWTIREGQGLLLKQGSVASVGNVMFLIAFTLE
jgi:hypothetical protein